MHVGARVVAVAGARDRRSFGPFSGAALRRRRAGCATAHLGLTVECSNAIAIAVRVPHLHTASIRRWWHLRIRLAARDISTCCHEERNHQEYSHSTALCTPCARCLVPESCGMIEVVRAHEQPLLYVRAGHAHVEPLGLGAAMCAWRASHLAVSVKQVGSSAAFTCWRTFHTSCTAPRAVLALREIAPPMDAAISGGGESLRMRSIQIFEPGALAVRGVVLGSVRCEGATRRRDVRVRSARGARGGTARRR